MVCCKRTDRSARRRARRNGANQAEKQFETEDPIGDSLSDFPSVISAEKSPDGKYDIALLQPDQALIMPMKGKGALKRVYLGIGWKSKEKIDVDCVCACA